MDVKYVEKLARLMKENQLTALEITEEGSTVKLERKGAAQPAVSEALSPFTPAPAGDPGPGQNETGYTVTAPTVGVFYSAPSPDSEPFVRIGDRVEKGDVLCIIEAMKLMNEIPSEKSGTVVEICAGDGQVVEYGQPLFRLMEPETEGK